MPDAGPLLAVVDVTKRFGGVAALAGCTFDVAPGTITGLIGPNGAGKTTLFNAISGLITPDAGQIQLGPHRLDGLASHGIARLGVGRTFQIPRPLGRMTVLDNLLVYGKEQSGEALTRVFAAPGRVRRQEVALARRARGILEFMELLPLANALAETLSGGQKKLLELARVLMGDPEVILLDEPGAGSVVLLGLLTREEPIMVSEHDDGRAYVDAGDARDAVDGYPRGLRRLIGAGDLCSDQAGGPV